MAKQKQTKLNKPTDTTEYRIYSEHSQDTELANKLLDLFVQAFINTELDTLISQRSNNNPISEEDKTNE
jgi:spore coat polysaccharide biosynthesis protein SpsF (cytidylyltransferase family)